MGNPPPPSHTPGAPVYLFAAHHGCRYGSVRPGLHGRRHGLDFDPELLYVGALFHDLGLTEKFRTGRQRSELDGADEARARLTARGIPPAAPA
ncbi:hypothetical protein [Streptomyces decoyicus]|uniref:hypothetical protein n=1 Tax=Streptomyces decoyicus TaxID=249567 RepID=UPI00386C9DF6